MNNASSRLWVVEVKKTFSGRSSERIERGRSKKREAGIADWGSSNLCVKRLNKERRLRKKGAGWASKKKEETTNRRGKERSQRKPDAGRRG